MKKIFLFLLLSVNAFGGLPPSTSQGMGDTLNVPTFNFQFPGFAVTHTGVTAAFSLGANTVTAAGYTGAMSNTSTSPVYGAGTNAAIVWSTLVAATASGVQITGTGGTWFNGYGASSQAFAAGVGSVSFTFQTTGGNNRGVLGLSDATTLTASSCTGLASTINCVKYGIFNATGTSFQVTEYNGSSSSQPYSGTFSPSDVFKITSTGSTVTYSQNGSVVYTSAMSNSGSVLYPSASTFGANQVNLTGTYTTGSGGPFNISNGDSLTLAMEEIDTALNTFKKAPAIPVQASGVTPTCTTSGCIAFTHLFLLCVYNGSSWVTASTGTVACTF